MGLCYLYIQLLALLLIFKAIDEVWTNLSHQNSLPSYKFCKNEQLSKCYTLMVLVKEELQYWLKYNAWHWTIQERPVIDLRSPENSHLGNTKTRLSPKINQFLTALLLITNYLINL